MISVYLISLSTSFLNSPLEFAASSAQKILIYSDGQNAKKDPLHFARIEQSHCL